MSGLGPDPRSYCVGDKSVINPGIGHAGHAQMVSDLQAQQRYALGAQQLACQAQQIAYMGNLAMSGLGMHGFAVASGDQFGQARYEAYVPDGWAYGPPKPKWKFMQRTKQGRGMRAVLEVLFWLGTAVFVTGWVILPVVIKLGTVLWAWALT